MTVGIGHAGHDETRDALGIGICVRRICRSARLRPLRLDARNAALLVDRHAHIAPPSALE